MNVLPLILALVLMLSVMTIERLEKFKNLKIVQREYQIFLEQSDRYVFNQREKALFGLSEKNLRQLSFRYLLDKKMRDKELSAAKQYKTLNMELIKIVYGETAFYKELQGRRPQFLEEMMAAIEKAAEVAPDKLIKRTRDIARLHLEDPELQEAFYHMLKGTIPREKLIKMSDEMTSSMKEKGYPSLLTYINDEGAKGIPTIKIQYAPSETLKSIFVTDEVVEKIIEKREALSKKQESGDIDAFKKEFIAKVRSGIDDKLLDFKITSTDLTAYR